MAEEYPKNFYLDRPNVPIEQINKEAEAEKRKQDEAVARVNAQGPEMVVEEAEFVTPKKSTLKQHTIPRNAAKVAATANVFKELGVQPKKSVIDKPQKFQSRQVSKDSSKVAASLATKVEQFNQGLISPPDAIKKIMQPTPPRMSPVRYSPVKEIIMSEPRDPQSVAALKKMFALHKIDPIDEFDSYELESLYMKMEEHVVNYNKLALRLQELQSESISAQNLKLQEQTIAELNKQIEAYKTKHDMLTEQVGALQQRNSLLVNPANQEAVQAVKQQGFNEGFNASRIQMEMLDTQVKNLDMTLASARFEIQSMGGDLIKMTQQSKAFETKLKAKKEKHKALKKDNEKLNTDLLKQDVAFAELKKQKHEIEGKLNVADEKQKATLEILNSKLKEAEDRYEALKNESDVVKYHNTKKILEGVQEDLNKANMLIETKDIVRKGLESENQALESKVLDLQTKLEQIGVQRKEAVKLAKDLGDELAGIKDTRVYDFSKMLDVASVIKNPKDESEVERAARLVVQNHNEMLGDTEEFVKNSKELVNQLAGKTRFFADKAVKDAAVRNWQIVAGVVGALGAASTIVSAIIPIVIAITNASSKRSRDEDITPAAKKLK